MAGEEKELSAMQPAAVGSPHRPAAFAWRNVFPLLSLLLVVPFFSACLHDLGDNPPVADVVRFSPAVDQFLDLVSLQDENARRAAVDSFLAGVRGNPKLALPLVDSTRVVFIYQGDVLAAPKVPGDYNGWKPDRAVMTRIAGTDVYYRLEPLPLDARFAYRFNVDRSRIIDTLNPFTLVRRGDTLSEAWMPAYRPPVEIEKHTELIPGRIINKQFTSDILGDTRLIRWYLPPGYGETSQSYPTLYVFRGGAYLHSGKMENVLDYCINKGFCRPLIVIFITTQDFLNELELNESVRRMVVEEIVPWVDGELRTLQDPSQRGILGASVGGLMALNVALRNPEVFGLAGGQSPSIWYEDEWMIREFRARPKAPLRIYLDVGTFETSMVEHLRTLRGVLKEKGYPLRYREWDDFHVWENWRAHIDDALEALYPPER